MAIPFPLPFAVIADRPDCDKQIKAIKDTVPQVAPLLFDDPEEAWSRICEDKIRIVMADLGIRNMGGFSLIQQCLSLDWHIDCLVVSDPCHKEEIARCFDAGARQILLKPVDEELMISGLRRILTRVDYWKKTLEDMSRDFTDRSLSKMAGEEDI